MSPEQKRYAMAKAAREVSRQTEREIIESLETDDMTEDDRLSLYVAADEAAHSMETMNELFAAEEALVAWAYRTVSRYYPIPTDVRDMMANGSWKKYIKVREQIVDISFRLHA